MGIVHSIFIQATLLTFISTGLLQNLIQLGALIFVYPFHTNTYRRIAEVSQIDKASVNQQLISGGSSSSLVNCRQSRLVVRLEAQNLLFR